LTASAGIAGWVEFALLRRTLNQRIGATGLAPSLAVRLWTGAIAAAVAGWGVKLALGRRNVIVAAIAILGVYGVAYFGAAALLRVEEGVEVLRKVGIGRKRAQLRV
jgi:putative peptidoglycan lipid II flippase